MDTQLLERLRRLHIAIGRVSESELSKFPARVFSNDRARIVVQDSSGGMSVTEISETLHALIHNIASFHDHLQKWGERNGVSRESIHNFLKNSLDFCIIRDLRNNDKHGYPSDRNDGWSRKAPRLANAYTICQLSTGTGENSLALMTFGKGGKPVVRTKGTGSVGVLLTGDVVDKNGNGLGDAHKFIEAAVRVCEAAIQRFVAQ